MKSSKKTLTKDAEESRFLRTISAFVIIVGSLTVGTIYTQKTTERQQQQWLAYQRQQQRQIQPVKEKAPDMAYAAVLGETNSTASFHLSSDTQTAIAGDTITATIHLTTDGTPFDAAVATLEWNPQEFQFLQANGKLSGQFISSFVKGDQGKRIFTHFIIPNSGTAMTTPTNIAAPFATASFKALVNNPASPIQLTTKDDDQIVHPADDSQDNMVKPEPNQEKSQLKFSNEKTVPVEVAKQQIQAQIKTTSQKTMQANTQTGNQNPTQPAAMQRITKNTQQQLNPSKPMNQNQNTQQLNNQENQAETEDWVVSQTQSKKRNQTTSNSFWGSFWSWLAESLGI